MAAGTRELLQLIGEIAGADDGDVSLAVLARRAGRSPGELHRRFKALARETPKQFAQRLRLERAAADLRGSNASVLQIALAHGFASHETFTRAFRRRFACAPRDHRAAAAARPPQSRRTVETLRAVGPCLNLYRLPLAARPETLRMPHTPVERRVLPAPQPILFIRRRIAQSALQATMGECFGALYGHAHAAGLPVAGHPIARYASVGHGLWTVDLAMPLAAPAEPSGDMQADHLPAGPVAFAVHQGPYDGLPETNAAIETWIEANGHAASGPMWEWYVTDPGETPDPADWRTEVYWPLQA